MNTILLNISNLESTIESKKILKKLNLRISENEIHVIMGPNGCGKSTFSKILVGHPSYQIEDGSIFFCNEDLRELSPEVRSHKGIFLAFQYPVEIPGVTNYDFLRISYNEKQKYLNKPELNPLEFMVYIQKFLDILKIKPEFLYRNLNEGFSGGEKKRNEILQMLVLEPKLIILDEIDSGLDIDAIKIICDTILLHRPKNSSLILITHYPKLLEYLKPDFVHIMMDGQILQTGGLELVNILEDKGYQSFL